MSAKNPSLQVESEADDWTQVEDRQERKRIQNRLAQRIYRKNLKQKLETLERLAKTLQAGAGSAEGPLALEPGHSSTPRTDGDAIERYLAAQQTLSLPGETSRWSPAPH
jgi:hypothetical protein